MSYKCLCGGVYSPLPDEDAVEMPPTLDARLFHCSQCGGTDWCIPEDFELEAWPDD